MDDIISPDSPLKQCNKCLHWKPQTTQYFSPEKSGKDGLRATCRECRKAQRRKPPKPPMTERECKICHEIKPIADFTFSTTKTKSGTTTDPICKECRNAKGRQSRRDNLVKIRAQERARWHKNREKKHQQAKARYTRFSAEQRDHTRERNKQWREKNQERVRENYYRFHALRPNWRREWRVTHQDRVHEHKRASYYRTDPGRRYERGRAYRQSNPEKVLAHNRNRRALERQATGTHTAEDIRQQYKRQKGKCYWCQSRMTRYHVDHVIPLSRGGSNDPSNLVIACPTCNVRRHNKLPHEWAEGGRLL